MKKKAITLLLVTTIILTCLCSCGKSTDRSSADTYLSMAQDFIDKNDHIAAMDILKKGFEETKDERIAIMIAELSTGTPVTNAIGETLSLKSFAGTWAEKDIGWIYGGMIMDVECTDNTIRIALSYTQSAPMSRIAEIMIEEELSNIKDSVLTAELVEDGWGNKTTVQISLCEPNVIQCNIVEVVPGETAMWGFCEDEYELFKNDNAHENMSYIMDDYYALYPEENPYAQPTYDTSKASGILAELGMSEQEFRENCEPLKMDIASSNSLITRDLREYPAQHTGKLFTIVSTLGNLLPLQISSKDASSDGYTIYIYYPDNDWKDYMIIFDMRDDIYSPTISSGDHIYPYMIYTGVQTLNGTDYLCFNLISVDKK